MKLNTSILAALATSASLIAAAPALADDAHHPGTTTATQPAATPAAQTVKTMQANVKKMQGQLERIAKAKNDGERQQAMAEHLQTMQENMQMARGMQAGMMGCPMIGMMGGQPGTGMGAGMMGGGMGMMGQGMSGYGDAMTQRMDMMEKRMDMMQMMMQGRMGMPATEPAKPAN